MFSVDESCLIMQGKDLCLLSLYSNCTILLLCYFLGFRECYPGAFLCVTDFHIRRIFRKLKFYLEENRLLAAGLKIHQSPQAVQLIGSLLASWKQLHNSHSVITKISMIVVCSGELTQFAVLELKLGIQYLILNTGFVSQKINNESGTEIFHGLWPRSLKLLEVAMLQVLIRLPLMFK